MHQEKALNNPILDGVIWKQLLAFFFPILFGTFFQQLYNTADAVIVGRYVGKEALAAVGGATGTLINLVVNLFVGISSGATVVVAQHYGSNNQDGMHKAVHSTVMLALIGGAAFTVLGLAASYPALVAMGTNSEVMPHAIVYLRVYFLGIIPSFLYNVGAGILRAIGDSRRPLYFLMTACMINIVLDLLFVAVFHMGTFGAAFATIISQFVSAILVLICLTKGDEPVHSMERRAVLQKFAQKSAFRWYSRRPAVEYVHNIRDSDPSEHKQFRHRYYGRVDRVRKAR